MNTEQVHDNWTGKVEHREKMNLLNGSLGKQKVVGVWRKVPELDAEIRKMYCPCEEIDEDYFTVQIGLYESLGEQGIILTLFYEDFPVMSEIKEDLINYLLETKKDLKNSILSHREEQYLKSLNKIRSLK